MQLEVGEEDQRQVRAPMTESTTSSTNGGLLVIGVFVLVVSLLCSQECSRRSCRLISTKHPSG